MNQEILQTLIVAVIVAAAALFVGARWLRTIRSARRTRDGAGCDAGCGCGH